MPEEDLVELKFRLYDGTDIGPIQYAGASTVQMLKERIFSEWPRDSNERKEGRRATEKSTLFLLNNVGYHGDL
ncbi:hypothetical protein Taro_049149 [Colocasia esculenta]|uniref:UBL3-like ubiquitin domain-containing protein n=1 Tax=Colocasia esculenta TaxID=4460 RepID=A0A843XA44_COLES|nr:hypothetical protein [Colocasia esculenta]